MSLYSALQKRIEALRKTRNSKEVTLHFDDGSSRAICIPNALAILCDLTRLRSWQLGSPEGREADGFCREDGGAVPKTIFAREMRLLASAEKVDADDPLVEAAHGLAREVFEAERKVGMLQGGGQ